VLECAESSILTNWNFREFSLARGGGILGFQKFPVARPKSRLSLVSGFVVHIQSV